MMKDIDFSNRPKDATHYFSSTGDRVNSYWKVSQQFSGPPCFVYERHSGEWIAMASLPNDIKPIDAKHSGGDFWNGNGLPPVGINCEYEINSEWHAITVVAHVHEYGKMLAVFQFTNTPTWSSGSYLERFRPIRTPDQIAEEERESELNRMVATAKMLDKGWARKVCAELYDAGYRKMVKPNEK